MEGNRQLSRSLQHLPTENATESGISVEHFHSPDSESRDEHFTLQLPGRISPTPASVGMLSRSLPRQPTSTPFVQVPMERSQTLQAQTVPRQEAVEECGDYSRSYPAQTLGRAVGEEGRNRAETGGRGGGGGGGGGVEQARALAECALCLDEFQDAGERVPRNLACGHTYCTGCIGQLLLYPVRAQPEVDCPKCHTITPIPEREVDKLPKNYGLLEVISCSSSSRSPSVLGGSPQLNQERREREEGRTNHICRLHGDHISSYCVQDDTLVCSSCILYGVHKGHRCLLVGRAAELEREKLRRLNPEVFRQRRKMENTLTQVEKKLKEVQEAGGSLQDSIDAQFSQLLSILDQRRQALRLEVMHRTQVRVQALMEQATDLRGSIAKASSAHSHTARLIEGSDFSLLQECTLALDQVEGVFTNPPSSLPRAAADLTSEFSDDVESEIVSQLEGYGRIKCVVGTIQNLYCDTYHDGIRVFWDGHNFADNEGISYHLQVLAGDSDYSILYRGGDTKYTWKTELEKGVGYKFRVQVRTTEGIGSWSEPVTAYKAEPGFRWHHMWRNVRIELSSDKMEASCYKGGSANYWATFAGNRLIDRGQLYVELCILDLGRLRPGKKKLAFGVIACSKSKVNSLPWQDGKCPIGRWKEPQSWSFHPILGTKNCPSFPEEGKPYTSTLAQVGDRVGMLLSVDEGTLHFFCNGQDLGVAFDNVCAEALLPAVSIRDKVRVRLSFPPPPYSKRDPKVIRFSSFGAASQQFRKRK